MGRPSSYTDEIADKIVTRLAHGEGLRTICRDDDLPDRSTVMAWVDTNEEFSHRYARARDLQADYFADDVIDIADDASLTPDDKRIKIDARKWRAGRQAPGRWGDKVQINANVASTVTVDASNLSPALRFLAGHCEATEGGSDPAAG